MCGCTNVPRVQERLDVQSSYRYTDTLREMWSGKLTRDFQSDSLLQENEAMFSQKVGRS